MTASTSITLPPAQAVAPVPDPTMRKRKRGGAGLKPELTPGRVIGTALMWGVVGLSVLMLIWIITQSLRDTRSILADPFGLPDTLHFENWVTAWTVGDFGLATFNSVVTAIVSSVLTVVVAAMAAYYLGRVDNRITRFLSNYFVLGLGIPVQVILIPLFIMLNAANLTNSLIGLNIVYVGVSMPFTVFLLIAFFRSIPAEVEEAAAIDGASAWRTMWTITMPLAKGGILTAFILQVISHWNETLLAMTLLTTTNKYTLPIALISFIQQQTYSGADWGGLFAGICIVVLPMLAMYMVVGRRLTEGLTMGMGK